MRRSSAPPVTATPWAMDILPSRAPDPVAAPIEPPALAAAGLPATQLAPQPVYAAHAPATPTYAAIAPAQQPIYATQPNLAAEPLPAPEPERAAAADYVPAHAAAYPPSFVMAPPPEAKKGWPTPVKVAIGIVGGLVLLGVLAAVAIPVFFTRKPPAVTLVLPSILQGSTPLTTTASEQAVSALKSSLTGNISFANPQAEIYGHGGVPTFGILAAKLTDIPSASAMQSFLAGASGAASSPLVPKPSGALGGLTSCGIETTNGTQVALCASIDKSAVVMVIVYSGDLTDDAALAQKVRLAVERH